MKTLLCFLLIFSLESLQAQNKSYTDIVAFIQNKVLCCSVPFTKGAAKVESIAIDTNGNISLFYSDKRPKNSFNLFELYKEQEGETGIDTILGGKFVQFFVNEKRARLIRFATTQDAKEVYQALLQLYNFKGDNEKKKYDGMNFSQTVDVINASLIKWAERGNVVAVAGMEDGTITIKKEGKQVFSFNLLELIPPDNDKWRGVETEACNKRSHAPLSWVNFKTTGRTEAFIRLTCNMPTSELKNIQNAFLHLRSLCIISNTPNGG